MKLRHLVVVILIALLTAGFGKLGRQFGLTGTRSTGTVGPPPVSPSTGGMQINTSTLSYFTGNSPFFNIWQTGGKMTVNSSLNGAVVGAAAWTATGTGGAAYFNPTTGELNNPVPSDVTSISRVIFTPPPGYSLLALSGNPWWYGAVINVSWQGTSTLTLAAGTSNSVLNVTGANSATVTLGSSLAAYNLALQFAITNVNNPPRNIIASFSTEAQLAGTVFTQNYANLIKIFGWLRVMKWTGGGTNYQSDISQLAGSNYNSLAQSFASTAMNSAWPTVPLVGADSDYGPAGGLHPSVVVALANKTGVSPWYNIPVAMTNAGMTAIAAYFISNLNPSLTVTFEYGNETCWNFAAPGPSAYVNAQTYPGTGTTGQPCPYTGYRAAQLFQIVHDTFGSGNRSRWRGTISGQQCCSSTAQAVINGAEYYLTNVAPVGTLLTDLFDEVITSGYFGNGPASIAISGASAVGATTTLTTSSNPTNQFINGQCVRLFFSVTTAGTLGALLNNKDVAISAITSTNISFTNNCGNSGAGAVSTTGLTYSAGTNYIADGLLFDLMDTSSTNHTNTPATYPTKYSYFTTQMWKALLSGTSANGYAGQANVFSGTNTLAANRQQNALVAGTYGLSYRYYEGGLEDITYLGDTNLAGNAQFADYGSNYKFDAGVVGDVTNTAAAVMAANNSASASAYSGWNSQFDDMGEPPGPWTPVRFYPGDSANPLWQAILAQNALGPYVDPSPAAPGTYAGITSNYTTASGNTQTFSANFGSNPTNNLAVVTIASQQHTAPTSVQIGASNVTISDSPTTCDNSCIYSAQLPANAGSQTITINWSGSASFTGRFAGVYLLTNLANATFVSNTPAPGTNPPISETRGSACIGVGKFNTAPLALTAGANGLLIPVAGTTFSGTNFGTSSLFVFSFSSPVMPIVGASGSVAAACYR